MANNKGKRPQTPKINKSEDPNRLALSLRNGDGPHGNPQAYNRTAAKRSWKAEL